MKNDLKKFLKFLYIELVLGVLSTFVLMLVTFNLDGVKGLTHLIQGYNDQFHKANYWNIIILLMIGFMLWVLSYFFNFRSKNHLKIIAQNLFDVGVNLLRVAGGLLISFTFLHIWVDGFDTRLIHFGLIGLVALSESALGSMFKDYLENKNYRPLKANT